MLFTRQQRSLALCPPSIARQGAIFLHHPMAGDQDSDRVVGDRVGYVSRITRGAHLGGDGAVGGCLASRNPAENVPDLFLIVGPPNVEREARVEIRTFDDSGELFDDLGKTCFVWFDRSFREACARGRERCATPLRKLKGYYTCIGNRSDEIAKGTLSPRIADSFAHRSLHTNRRDSHVP